MSWEYVCGIILSIFFLSLLILTAGNKIDLHIDSASILIMAVICFARFKKATELKKIIKKAKERAELSKK